MNLTPDTLLQDQNNTEYRQEVSMFTLNVVIANGLIDNAKCILGLKGTIM